VSDLLVQVRYFNVLADYAGTRRAEVRVPPGTTLRELLRTLSETHPEPFRRALALDDEVHSYIRVFRNDQLVAETAFDSPLADRDEILLFPAVAGGRDI
jgi:MoaD family protein